MGDNVFQKRPGSAMRQGLRCHVDSEKARDLNEPPASSGNQVDQLGCGQSPRSSLRRMCVRERLNPCFFKCYSLHYFVVIMFI